MKTIATFTDSPFYNSTAPLGGVWYGQPRASVRRKTVARRPYILEQDGQKQEIICSIILTLCLMFAFVSCFVQFVVS